MKLKLYTLSAVLLVAATASWAQRDQPRQPQPPGQPGQPGIPRPMRGDPMGDAMFPPELVMRAGQDIGLTDEQRTSIQQEMQTAQGGFEQMHKRLQAEMQGLATIMKQPNVDEAQAQSQFDKVLAAESEIKKAQISLMIHIKNRLTADQQAKLNEMKRNMQPPGGDRRGPPPGGEGFAPEGGRREGAPSGGERSGPQPGGGRAPRPPGPPPEPPEN